MKHAIAAVLALAIVSDLDATQNRGFKPTVLPLLSDSRAFLVEVPNTGTSDMEVTTWGRCRMRIDALEIPNNFSGGSGSQQTIKPGESWRELIRLVNVPASGRRVPNPLPALIVGNEAVVAHIKTGRHAVAFTCGGEWSDDLTFYWIEQP